MKDLLRRTQFLTSTMDSKTLKPSLSEVAFVGRSNVGKSSLLNILCEHKGLADVSKLPGRTRDINVYAAAHGRWIIDLPGYGFAQGPTDLRKSWESMIKQYLTSRPKLRAVVLMFDTELGPKPADIEMRQWLTEQNLPYILVGNKSDRVRSEKMPSQQTHIAKMLNVGVLDIRWISVTHGHGISPLRKEIVQLLSQD